MIKRFSWKLIWVVNYKNGHLSFFELHLSFLLLYWLSKRYTITCQFFFTQRTRMKHQSINIPLNLLIRHIFHILSYLLLLVQALFAEILIFLFIFRSTFTFVSGTVDVDWFFLFFYNLFLVSPVQIVEITGLRSAKVAHFVKVFVILFYRWTNLLGIGLSLRRKAFKNSNNHINI